LIDLLCSEKERLLDARSSLSRMSTNAIFSGNDSDPLEVA
jgi:hypothetical protein